MKARERTGTDWLYIFEGENPKKRCMEVYPQMYSIAQAMYVFAKETGELEEVAMTEGPGAWLDPKKIMPR